MLFDGFVPLIMSEVLGCKVFQVFFMHLQRILHGLNSTALWPLTLQYDRATWSFLKFDRRH